MTAVRASRQSVLGYKPLQQIAYERLRKEIARGRYQPGDRLRIAVIADSYGISAVPVREALRSLEAEGLIDFAPNRGAVIRRLTPAELDEIFLMRIPLESVALRRAIPNMTTADHNRLRQLIATMKESDTDMARWLDLNQEFHLEIYRLARLPRLDQIITTLWTLARPYIRVYMTRTKALAKAHHEHQALLRACHTGNVHLAVQILEGHLRRTAETVGTALRQADSERDAGDAATGAK